MNKFKFLSLTAILVAFIALLFVYSGSTASVEKNENSQNPEIKGQTSRVSYAVHTSEENKSASATVYIDGEEVVNFSQSAGGVIPAQRAAILAKKINLLITNKENPSEIYPGFYKGIAVIEINGKILLTADVKSAKSNAISVSKLALKWANGIREALGAQKLIRDYSLLDRLMVNDGQYAGFQQEGVASWYGAYFHGRTAADGSIYNMYKFTAAHKTLPFGAVVKVTNMNNKQSCIVKITDRGPFIGERIIDLSKIAADEIGMLEKGISEVKVEVIGKV